MITKNNLSKDDCKIFDSIDDYFSSHPEACETKDDNGFGVRIGSTKSRLISRVGLSDARNVKFPGSIQCEGVWDTGATTTMISYEAAEHLQLIKTGQRPTGTITIDENGHKKIALADKEYSHGYGNKTMVYEL